MWLSTDATPAGARRRANALPRHTGAPTIASLEQQHLRGWVSPDEFRARGVLIEINNDNTLTITRENRSDGDGFEDGATPDLGWRNANGQRMGDLTLGGVYRRVMPWPINGVIFAEGNIRVRGTAATPPRGLTIVSMNNIYIEDSLSAGTKKILLLAKKNVVVNPTRVLGQPDYQTRLSTTASANTSVLPVHDATQFEIGDWVEIDTGSGNDPVYCVTGVNAGTNNLTIDGSLANNHAAGLVVRTVSDPVKANGTPANEVATRLGRFNNVIQRRLFLPTGATTTRLALRHNAEERRAMEIGIQQAVTSPPGRTFVRGTLFNKWDPTAAPTDPRTTVIPTAQKKMTVQYTDSLIGVEASNQNQWPTTAVTDEGTARNYRLSDPARTEAAGPPATLHKEVRSSQTDPNWRYTVTMSPSAPATDPPGGSYNTGLAPTDFGPPFFFLASIGYRYPWSTPAATKFGGMALPLPQPQQVNAATGTWKIPMATSVGVHLNAWDVTDPLRNRTNGMATLESDRLEQVQQFGFNPWHFANPTAPAFNNGNEDVITSDLGFYWSGAGGGDNGLYTYDSRKITGYTLRPNAMNSLSFRLHPQAEPFFNATANDERARVPYYRLSRAKLENITVNAAGDVTELKPGYTLNIEAFVYAQEGSWIVLPGATFDASEPGQSPRKDVRRTHVNLPITGSTAGQDAGEDLDLDRDGAVTQAESAAVYRFRRYNYKINFKGAIAENRSAVVANSGTVDGAVQAWMESWPSFDLETANFGTNGAGQPEVNAATLDFGDEISSVEYEFDPAMMSTLQNLGADGIQVPMLPDVTYTN
jgi:hypothetical protein